MSAICVVRLRPMPSPIGGAPTGRWDTNWLPDPVEATSDALGNFTRAFCIESWVDFGALTEAGDEAVLTLGAWTLTIINDNALNPDYGKLYLTSADGATISDAAYSETWIFVTVQRDNDFRVSLYLDGVLQDSGSDPTDYSVVSGAAGLVVGPVVSSIELNFDDIRVTRGQRYSANFTPPTAPLCPFSP